jgi:hypothetical protein
VNDTAFDPDAFLAEDDFDPDAFLAEKPEPKTHDALTTFGMNALDSASIIGIPRALAAGEALAETFTGDGKEGIVDRYHRKVKENEPISKGMSADFMEHPVAGMGGQLATAFIPGPKAGVVRGVGALGKLAMKYPKIAKMLALGQRGAALGAVHGAVAGDADTAGGDIEGTLKDAAVGGAMGAGADLVGGAVGKLVEAGGNMASRKLRSDVLTKAKSIIGKYRQQKGEAGNALDRLEIMDELKKAAAAAPAGLPRTPARRMIDKFPGLDTPLRGARVGNAAKDFGQFERNVAKFGSRGVPKIDVAKGMALKDLKKNAGGVLRNLAVRSGGAIVGAELGKAAGNAAGVDPVMPGIIGGLAGGGGSNFFLIRKTTGAILTHPDVLEKVARVVPGLGRALATGGRRLAETVLMAHLRSEGGRKKVLEALSEEEDPPPDDIDLQGYDPDAPEKGPRAPGTLDKGVEPKFDPFEQMPKHLQREETLDENAAIEDDIGKEEYAKYKAQEARKRKKYPMRPAPVPEVKFDHAKYRRPTGGSL